MSKIWHEIIHSKIESVVCPSFFPFKEILTAAHCVETLIDIHDYYPAQDIHVVVSFLNFYFYEGNLQKKHYYSGSVASLIYVLKNKKKSVEGWIHE